MNESAKLRRNEIIVNFLKIKKYYKILMKPEPGTYALILQSYKNAKVQIGRRGRLSIKPGFYICVGSAWYIFIHQRYKPIV